MVNDFIISSKDTNSFSLRKTTKSSVPVSASISNLVSCYQTNIGVDTLLESASNDQATDKTQEKSADATRDGENCLFDTLRSKTSNVEVRSTSVDHQETIEAHIAKFQPTFDSNHSFIAPSPSTQTKPTAKKANFSRASISALINLEENGPVPDTVQKLSTQAEKRKRLSPKSESAAKKVKSDELKKFVKVKKDTGAEAKGDTKKYLESDASKDTVKKASNSDLKKVLKAKKKSPEVVLPSQDKPSIHPMMTTEKGKTPSASVNLPPPTFITTEDGGSGEIGICRIGDDKEKLHVPVIVLDIPLLDPKHPKPGQAEVVVNVLRLAEEKYGWSAVHPEARSAFELMDDVLDDEEEGDEEDDEEVMLVDEKGNSLKRKNDGTDKKKRKAQSQSLQTKVNRKVGKYDFEDPFIDDAELQWEEEITTTKEGFFVYWGPLVDERQSTKKSTAKGKK